MSYEEFRPSRFQILPPVVKNLLIINGIFFLAKTVFENSHIADLSDLLGLHFFLAPNFKPFQLITYMFMHANFTHIFFNMFALWMFGSALENVWGGKRFLTYYLITGIGAVIIHYSIFYFETIKPKLETIDAYVSNPTPETTKTFIDFMVANTPSYNPNEIEESKSSQVMRDHFEEFTKTQVSSEQEKIDAVVDYSNTFKNDFLNLPNVVGASGAVFGILLAFGMMFPNTMLYIYFAIPIKAKYFVILYGAMELVMGIVNSKSDNVAHFAHLGGMLFGFILIKIWQHKPNQFQ